MPSERSLNVVLLVLAIAVVIAAVIGGVTVASELVAVNATP